MRSVTAPILAVSIYALISPANGQDIQQCEAVLRVAPTQSSSTYRFDTQTSAYIDSLCQQRFSDYGSASNFAGRAGLSIPLVDGLFRFSANAKNDSSTFKREYEEQCRLISDTKFREARVNELQQSYSTIIYQSWLSCIDALAKGRRVFAYSNPQGDLGDKWVINIKTNPATGSSIKINSILPRDLNCTLADGSPALGYQTTNRDFAIECSKPGAMNISATIETSEGTIQSLELPGRKPIEPVEALRREIESQLVPRGAILPFEARKCPNGWAAYIAAEGRFILGHLSTPQPGRVITEAPGTTGGAPGTVLSMDQIPAHRHESEVGTLNGEGVFGQSDYIGNSIHGIRRGGAHKTWTSTTGSGSPRAVDTVPPFVSLLYCIKQ